jgi:hypothetical protein
MQITESLSIIYYAIHPPCGNDVRLSEYRIGTRADLKQHEGFQPCKLRCPKCWLEFDATHFEIYESERLRMNRIVGGAEIASLGDVCKELASK